MIMIAITIAKIVVDEKLGHRRVPI